LENERAAPLVFSIKQTNARPWYHGRTAHLHGSGRNSCCRTSAGEYMMDKEKTERIRRLNDRFRRSGLGGDILITQGIQSLGEAGMQAVATKVAEFNKFDHDNDPHGEHDFGAFDHDGRRIFWKIDYYGPDMMSGSEDPSNPDVTRRVLTIMLASEY
tara:strand:+ start:1176 stop:1646 length:471 start_codon:yes stop_codon:yes gene_type:complete